MLRIKGFTLVELMVVVAIIAIISTVAYPSYTEYVRKSKRSDAHAGIQQVMAAQERYFAKERAYADFANPFNGVATLPSPEGNYTISVEADEPNRTYVVTATPAASSGQVHDTNCLTLFMANTGKKSSTGAYAVDNRPLDCWK